MTASNELTAKKPILFKIGPIGISRTTDIIQTTRTISGGRPEVFKRLWGHLMYRSRVSGSKVAVATEADIKAIRLLIDEGREYFDKWQGDEISSEHLLDRLDALLDDADQAQGRVLFGLETLLDNAQDPDRDHLAFTPEIEEGLWLRRRFGWLIWLMNAINLRPWSW